MFIGNDCYNYVYYSNSTLIKEKRQTFLVTIPAKNNVEQVHAQKLNLTWKKGNYVTANTI